MLTGCLNNLHQLHKLHSFQHEGGTDRVRIWNRQTWNIWRCYNSIHLHRLSKTNGILFNCSEIWNRNFLNYDLYYHSYDTEHTKHCDCNQWEWVWKTCHQSHLPINCTKQIVLWTHINFIFFFCRRGEVTCFFWIYVSHVTIGIPWIFCR